MSDFRMVYTRPDGGVTIVSLAVPGPGETEADIAARALAKIPEDAKDLFYCYVSDILAVMGNDRWFRNGLRNIGGVLTLPLETAKEAHRERIRQSRTLNWHQLDLEQMRAMGKADTVKTQEVEDKKQVWRDAPSDPRIEAATTLEELRAVWPTDLPLPPV